MKVKILKTTVANGVIVEKGKSLDLKDDEAKILIRMGKAELVKDRAPKAAPAKATPTTDSKPTEGAGNADEGDEGDDDMDEGDDGN